jgi:uncharacterized protein (TIGR03067 family)
LPLEKWSITETTVTADILGGEHKFAYKLDLKSAPAGIDLTPLDGPDKGKTYPGIFTRDGDFLEVCYDSRPGAKRPKVFVSRSDLGGSRSLAFVKAEQLNLKAVVTRHNLKVIGEAIHGYVKEHGHLPPAHYDDKTGRPLLSWRVEVCPFLEQSNVYSVFRHDEPWDGPTNRQVSGARLKVYTSLADNHPTLSITRYRVFEGKGTLFEVGEPLKLPKHELLASTVLVAESKATDIWSRPVELAYAADQPLPPLGGVVEGGFHVLLADGSVRFVKDGFNEKVFRQLVLRDKAKPVRWGDLFRD